MCALGAFCRVLGKLVNVFVLPPRPVAFHLKFDEAEMEEIWNYLPTDLQVAMNEGEELQAEKPLVFVDEDGKLSLSIRISVARTASSASVSEFP